MNEMLTKLKTEVSYLRRLACETTDAYLDSHITKNTFLNVYRQYQTQLHVVSQMLDIDDLQDYIEHVDYKNVCPNCDIQYITVEYKHNTTQH